MDVYSCAPILRPLLCGLASILLLDGLTAPVQAEVQISEFMASNTNGVQDEDGAFSDWIEIHNAGGSPVDLAGWHLTDTKTNLVRWTFPATHLPAGEFLTVFASGKDRVAPNLHANFSLSANGEYLALVRPDGTTIEHEYAPAYPEQFPNISYGVQTHGSNPTLRDGRPGYLIYHTPGTANTCLPAPHPLYSDDSVAQVDITLSQSSWDALMNDPWNDNYQPVEVRFRHGDIDLTVTNAGIKCRGNSSREHQPRSFNIAFNAYTPGQTLLDLERLNLNGDANDAAMARPKLLNDLHNTMGLPAPNANHVALVVHGPDRNRGKRVNGRFFDAIRNNTQPVDDVFLKQHFDTSRGNLYKCNNRYSDPASLEYRGPTGSSYENLGNGETYELRYAGSGDSSYNDLADFIALIDQTSNADFPNAIYNAFDVEAFLKRMALDVLSGHWDDYWVNANNYNLFLNPDTRRWCYIPYDFDNAFGIRWIGDDWGNQYIYDWTDISGYHPQAPLASRLMDVPEFKDRYSYYMSQMLDTVYDNATLDPALFHTRATLIDALPFDAGSVTNMKVQERWNYDNDWPYWSYNQFYWSYQYPQEEFSPVPNTYGITEFISTRRASALSQLNLRDISPVLSEFTLSPSLPRTSDAISISIQALDDSAVTNVAFVYSFDGGATQSLEMVLQADGSYETNLPAFGTNGTLRYFVRAYDDAGQSTTHPYGGESYAAHVEIESAALNVVFSEINYHPLDPNGDEIAAGFTDADDFEFVELLNVGDSPLDLTGFGIKDGIAATFPAFTLTNGEYAVVVANANAFRSRSTNPDVRIIDIFGGKLSNGGETLRLEDAQGGLITSVTYGDSGSWPGRADGDGSSIEVIEATGDLNASTNWRSSSEFAGSPGSAGLGPDNRIVINEVLTHTDPPLCDTIELFNTTESAIDIGGWTLSDATSNYVKYAIADGTILAAGEYIVFNETNDFNTSMGVDSNDFALSGAHGDDVFLMETDSSGRPIRFVDRVEFRAAANGESFGRWPNGSGRLAPMMSRTFGDANSGPRVGPVLINEIMYNPPSSNSALEFVEIYNPTALPIDLTRWELDGAVDYLFPSNAILPAGHTLVVTPFNPANPSNDVQLAEFRSTYGISTNVPLVGGFDGHLDNGGERLRLLRPDTPPIEEPTFYPLLIEDEMAYDEAAPWPLSADGGGASLSRLIPAGWGDDAASWMPDLPPTPGSNGVPPVTHSLTVVSDHGTPFPGVGTHAVIADVPFTNSAASPATVGSTRYLCTGWTMEGNIPLSGTTNSFSMTLTNEAILTWLWDTNFALIASSGPGGSVLPASGWHPIGATVELEAIASNGFAFVAWTGDTNAILSGDSSTAAITVTVDTPVSLTAHFEALMVTYYVDPSGSHLAPYTNWATASTSLHEIAAYAPPASTVLVAATTYTLPSTLSLSNALHLKSASGPADTILYGGFAHRVLLLSHPNATVEGFTVMGGDSGASSGGGIRINGAGRLVNCIINSNFSDKKGGGVAMIGGGEVRNCLFYFNFALNERGGGLYTYTEATVPLIENCTFSHNNANDGGGVYLLNEATLRNSIVWGNTNSYGHSNLFLEGGGQIVEYTAAGPAPSGTGNLGADPRFLDAPSGNFRLAGDSPAINAGTPRPWMAEAFDLDGRPREIYGTNDLGAFEGFLGTVDSDEDRIDDWQESQAGTDPFNPSSFLGIQSAGMDVLLPGQFVLSWSSATGRRYRITYSTNMAPPFLVAYSNILADPPTNTYTGILADPGPAFYRIELE